MLFDFLPPSDEVQTLRADDPKGFSTLLQLKRRIIEEKYKRKYKEGNYMVSGNYYVAGYMRLFALNGLKHIPFLEICLKAALTAEKYDLFEISAICALVDSAWNEYGECIHIILSIIHFVYIAMVFSLNIWIHSNDLEGPLKTHALTISVLSFSLVFIVMDLWQLKTYISENSLKEYFNGSWVSWISYLLTMIGSSLRLHFGKETKTSSDVMALATLFVFLNGVDFLRPFRLTGPIVIIVYAIIWKVLPLLLILVVVNLGFSQAFYLVSYNDRSLDSHDAGVSILFTFVYFTGQANWNDMFNTNTPALALILMVLFISLTTILLLNLIIALMNNVYSTVQENAEGVWKREQCKLVIKYHRWRSICTWLHADVQGAFNETQQYLCILMRDEYAKQRIQMQIRRVSV